MIGKVSVIRNLSHGLFARALNRLPVWEGAVDQSPPLSAQPIGWHLRRRSPSPELALHCRIAPVYEPPKSTRLSATRACDPRPPRQSSTFALYSPSQWFYSEIETILRDLRAVHGTLIVFSVEHEFVYWEGVRKALAPDVTAAGVRCDRHEAEKGSGSNI